MSKHTQEHTTEENAGVVDHLFKWVYPTQQQPLMNPSPAQKQKDSSYNHFNSPNQTGATSGEEQGQGQGQEHGQEKEGKHGESAFSRSRLMARARRYSEGMLTGVGGFSPFP